MYSLLVLYYVGYGFDSNAKTHWLAVGGKDAIVSLWRINTVLKEGGFLGTGKKEECDIQLVKLITGFENAITCVDYDPTLQILVCGDRKGNCYWRSVSSGCLIAVSSMSSLILPLVKESVKSIQFLKMRILSNNDTVVLLQFKIHHSIQFILLRLRYSMILAYKCFSEEILLPDFFVDENRSIVLLCHQNGFYCCSLSDFNVSDDRM